MDFDCNSFLLFFSLLSYLLFLFNDLVSCCAYTFRLNERVYFHAHTTYWHSFSSHVFTRTKQAIFLFYISFERFCCCYCWRRLHRCDAFHTHTNISIILFFFSFNENIIIFSMLTILLLVRWKPSPIMFTRPFLIFDFRLLNYRCCLNQNWKFFSPFNTHTHTSLERYNFFSNNNCVFKLQWSLIDSQYELSMW